MVKYRLEKSCLPKIAAMIGVTRSSTKALTRAPNAAPITNATASSTRLPRIRNVRNSVAHLCIAASFRGVAQTELSSVSDDRASSGLGCETRCVQAARRWLRNLAVGAAVGLGVGVVVGGTLGRAFMRILTLAQDDARGFETAAGAIVGEFTADGTGFIYVFGGFVGLFAGIVYVLVRPALPS